MKAVVQGVFIGVFFLGCILFGTGQAASQTVELKLAHFMSPVHVQHRNSFVPFAEAVKDRSGGKISIKIFPGGALGGPKQLPDAVKSGITDMAFIIPSYTTGRFPRVSVLDLPFMVNSATHATKVAYDLWDRYIAEDFKDYEVLWLYSSGAGQLHSATKPIRTLEDLKGMKMRAPSAYMGKALKFLGATSVGMPISELTISLQKGTIDGMLTPYSAIPDFRLWDLVKFVTHVNMYVSPMAVVMNKGKFASLPDEAKKALKEAAGEGWGLHAARIYDDEDIEVVEKINREDKIQQITLSDPEMDKFREQTDAVIRDWMAEAAGKGLPARELLDAARASSKKFE